MLVTLLSIGLSGRKYRDTRSKSLMIGKKHRLSATFKMSTMLDIPPVSIWVRQVRAYQLMLVPIYIILHVLNAVFNFLVLYDHICSSYKIYWFWAGHQRKLRYMANGHHLPEDACYGEFQTSTWMKSNISWQDTCPTPRRCLRPATRLCVEQDKQLRVSNLSKNFAKEQIPALLPLLECENDSQQRRWTLLVYTPKNLWLRAFRRCWKPMLSSEMRARRGGECLQAPPYLREHSYVSTESGPSTPLKEKAAYDRMYIDNDSKLLRNFEKEKNPVL